MFLFDVECFFLCIFLLLHWILPLPCPTRLLVHRLPVLFPILIVHFEMRRNDCLASALALRLLLFFFGFSWLCLLSPPQARTTGGRIDCCFDPRIYVAVQGVMAAGISETFTLQPELSCQEGYKAVGGTSGVYADACEACEAGRYQDLPGQVVCKECLPGQVQPPCHTPVSVQPPCHTPVSASVS